MPHFPTAYCSFLESGTFKQSGFPILIQLYLFQEEIFFSPSKKLRVTHTFSFLSFVSTERQMITGYKVLQTEGTKQPTNIAIELGLTELENKGEKHLRQGKL